MAEEEELQSTAGTADQEQPAGPQFALQRIYLKVSQRRTFSNCRT